MANLGVASHPTIHADPPSGGSTRTEPDLQRHPYTNEAKERVMPNSKIPTQTQKWATDHFGAHFLGRCGSRPPTSSRTIPIPHTHTHTGLGQAGPNLKLKSRSPIVGKRWSLNLYRHPYAKITRIRPVTTLAP